MYWRTLPVLIAAVVWLTLSEGDLVVQKIPYNKNKSKARSIAMAFAGFLAYIGCRLSRHATKYQDVLELLDLSPSHREWFKICVTSTKSFWAIVTQGLFLSLTCILIIIGI